MEMSLLRPDDLHYSAYGIFYQPIVAHRAEDVAIRETFDGLTLMRDIAEEREAERTGPHSLHVRRMRAGSLMAVPRSPWHWRVTRR